MPTPDAIREPEIGIFWFVLDGAGARHMLAEGCALSVTEAYGDCLTFSPGHYEVWDRWRRAGPPNAELAALVRDDEYDEWPRGRIVFEQTADRFVLYADQRITAARLTSKVAEYFHLPGHRVVVRYDLHYQSPRKINSVSS